MDALSGTASIFAVLSLAFQVAQTAIELKRALDTISNAASEAVRLQDIVLQVHYIATATKDLFERQTSLLEASHYVSQTYFTLAFCERELVALRHALRISEKVKMGKTPVSRTWASIRLACTSDQVEKSTNRLAHALSLLNTNFLLNLTSPLQIAITCNMINIVRILKRYGADASYCSAGAWSTLHYFFDEDKDKSSADFANALGDDLSFDEIKDPEGWTALHRCAAWGQAEDVYLLHRLGASTNPDHYLTNLGWNPIHVAAWMDNVSTLEGLLHLAMSTSVGKQTAKLDSGIANFVDFNGWSPLHLAVYRRATASARWLLHNNADPNMKTYRNANWFPEGYEGEVFEAVDLARMSGEKYLARFLDLLEEVGHEVVADGEEIFWGTVD
ncbi:hypothetical protein G7054_g6617 [Neopestalotiopsis clavispora]|nr:hypothetical protein G7054_g6617 [Neopestalotiopsis clavispora]